jgi:plastocyanin
MIGSEIASPSAFFLLQQANAGNKSAGAWLSMHRRRANEIKRCDSSHGDTIMNRIQYPPNIAKHPHFATAMFAVVLSFALVAYAHAQANSERAQTTAAVTPVSAGTVQASIDNFAFAPKRLTVKAGTTVVWTNKDDTPHTVTSDDNAFSSSLMDTNAKFQYTFTKPGKFPYHCKLHPMMTGVVEVQ